MASLFKVKALYDFEAKEEDDLGFPAAQIIDVTEEVDDNWLEGRYTDASGGTQSGIFPREFVEKYEPEVPSRPTRPSRPKQEASSAAPVPLVASQPVARAPGPEPATGEEGEEDAPPVPAMSKPLPPPVEASKEETARSPPPAPKPTPAEPAVSASASAGSKKPPPVAAKSNAFRDRIAAFNQPAASPIAPMVPGGSKPQSNSFIKKPFVAPPPMANAYVPPPKVDPVHKPYMRDEDPEIKRRQEEDRAAAEAAGFVGEPSSVEQPEDEEDAPKPTSLKERIARLQQQQMEQAQRRAEGGGKKEKKPPVKKPSESSDQGVVLEAEGEDMERERSAETERQSLDVSRDRPRVPSTQRRPQEPLSSLPPEHELVSDGNEADQSAAGETEDDTGTIGPEDSDDTQAVAPPPPPRAVGAPRREPDVGDEEDTTEEATEGEEEDSMDEDTRRRMELRERMAKMSGGMGMPGMFGPPGGMPLPAKKKGTKDKKPTDDEASSPPPPQQRISMIPIPGMNRVQSPESDRTQTLDKDEIGDRDEEEDEAEPMPLPRRSTTVERGPPPPVPKDSRPPQERGAPPPVPTSNQPTNRPPAPESRPVPAPPVPVGPMSPGPGSESDDEASIHRPGEETSGGETPGPIPFRTASMAATIQSPDNRRTSSYFSSEPVPVASDKRASRPPPPIPGGPATSRPPPPPPPGQTPSRVATGLDDTIERGESDYEGDYDTDIASSAKHKDALKAHVREPSLDDSTTGPETPVGSPPPPPPHITAPRAVPPPPPQAQPKGRPSMEAPQSRPPVPPRGANNLDENDEDYDPYRYDSQAQQRSPPPPVPGGVPIGSPTYALTHTESVQESSADDFHGTSSPRPSMDRPPPAPPRDRPVPAPPQENAPPARVPPRQSLDVNRGASISARRSMDQPRPSGENDTIAHDINLGEETQWWTTPQPLPPVLQSRNGVDVLSESEESTTSKRGGRTTISKDIYVLYTDYSQTIITARYDSKEPADVQLEQRHEPPPPKLRQDQLEAYWQRFGSKISEAANQLGHSKKENIVADGSPAGFVAELISHAAALRPIGTRAYGALVYANLANASTLQHDEIRPGDVVTLRNARFEGTHGAMKHKYKQEYGPNHVAIVEEWDGTRRAIRAWEQGREKKDKGVRSEKFRLGDLKSGEVRVWRVVGRDWVEWEN